MNISPNAQLKIQLGKDGNPKIYACGTEMEQKALCAALIAGICIDQRNPEALLSIVPCLFPGLCRPLSVHAQGLD